MSLLRIRTDMPPTDNHIYFNISGGGRAMNKKAKKFKSAVKQAVSRKCLVEGLSFDQKNCHLIFLDIYYGPEEVISKQHWRPFLKNDASNRTKLLIDAVSEGAGIDDGCLFLYFIRKNVAVDGITGVDVTLRLISPEILLAWSAFCETIKEDTDGPERCADLGIDQFRPTSGG